MDKRSQVQKGKKRQSKEGQTRNCQVKVHRVEAWKENTSTSHSSETTFALCSKLGPETKEQPEVKYTKLLALQRAAEK